MSVVEQLDYRPLAIQEDPDDYRPRSELAIVIDPDVSDEAVAENLTVFFERIAPGDRIPEHVHTVDEVLFVDEGVIEARLNERSRTIEPGAVVFVPAGMPHGFRNVGDEPARIHAVFPAREISIRYLERNPAPGTEGQPPGPPLMIDVRELLEGDPDRAVRPLHPT